MSFMTSRTLIDNGGKSFLADKDFSEGLDFGNEQMSFDFIIESFEGHLNNLKNRDVYVDKLANMP